jgi:hypothetical protein
MNTAPLLTSATYGALLLVVIGLWFGRRVWISALVVAVALGYSSGVLYGLAIVWIAALAGCCYGYDRARNQPTSGARRALMSLAAFGIIVLGVLLGMHALPGFHNWLVLDKVVLSSGAEPYTLYLNFDKTLVGVFILGFCNPRRLTRAEDWLQSLRKAAPVALILLLGVALSALALRYLTWQPKWTPLFWIWAANNLFFTCLSEEAFFRGFIQHELGSALRDVHYGSALAIAASAVLFGLAHFAGGMSYVLLAAVAGLGYALVYHRTRSIEMSMLTHFTLNAMHFLLFTYPRAA